MTYRRRAPHSTPSLCCSLNVGHCTMFCGYPKVEKAREFHRDEAEFLEWYAKTAAQYPQTDKCAQTKQTKTQPPMGWGGWLVGCVWVLCDRARENSDSLACGRAATRVYPKDSRPTNILRRSWVAKAAACVDVCYFRDRMSGLWCWGWPFECKARTGKSGVKWGRN